MSRLISSNDTREKPGSNSNSTCHRGLPDIDPRNSPKFSVAKYVSLRIDHPKLIAICIN